jgi:hypothetical protein
MINLKTTQVIGRGSTRNKDAGECCKYSLAKSVYGPVNIATSNKKTLSVLVLLLHTTHCFNLIKLLLLENTIYLWSYIFCCI